MAEFKLKRRQLETFNLDIDGKIYEIPLAEGLTPEEASPLDTAEGTRAFFNSYLPGDVVKTLTVADYNDITNAWVKASNKAGE